MLVLSHEFPASSRGIRFFSVPQGLSFGSPFAARDLNARISVSGKTHSSMTASKVHAGNSKIRVPLRDFRIRISRGDPFCRLHGFFDAVAMNLKSLFEFTQRISFPATDFENSAAAPCLAR
jgi:hypothetical protein